MRERRDPWDLILAAWMLSLVATLGSLNYSGIGFLGLKGLGLPPCEMCWYQRILMYPLVGILGVAYLKRDPRAARLGLGFAIPGALLAAYHSVIQAWPDLEGGECIVGACSVVMYRVLGLTIPNQSLVAFLLITGLLMVLERVRRNAPAPQPAPRDLDPDPSGDGP